MLREFGGDGGVVGRIGDHGDAVHILRRRTNHGRAADVDIFDELFDGEIGARGGGFERIQIHDHQINRRDSLLPHLIAVGGFAAAEQDAAMDLGMQRLDASAEHFRPAGEVGDIAHGQAGIAQQLGGAAGGNDLDLGGGQGAREFHDAGLVVNAYQCAFDGHSDLRDEKAGHCTAQIARGNNGNLRKTWEPQQRARGIPRPPSGLGMTMCRETPVGATVRT